MRLCYLLHVVVFRSFQKGSMALLPIIVYIVPNGLDSTMYQHPHHGWHLWSNSQCFLDHGCLLLYIFTGLCSFRIFNSFCALWPEGCIFLAHTLILSSPVQKPMTPSASESSPRSLAWPSGHCQSLRSTFYHVGLWISVHVVLALCLAFFFLVYLVGSCLSSSIHQESLFIRNNKNWSPSLGCDPSDALFLSLTTRFWDRK